MVVAFLSYTGGFFLQLFSATFSARCWCGLVYKYWIQGVFTQELKLW
jgi:hypothetical protein